MRVKGLRRERGGELREELGNWASVKGVSKVGRGRGGGCRLERGSQTNMTGT